MSHGRNRRRAESLAKRAEAHVTEAAEVWRARPSWLRPFRRRAARRRYEALMAEAHSLADRAAALDPTGGYGHS